MFKSCREITLGQATDDDEDQGIRSISFDLLHAYGSYGKSLFIQSFVNDTIDTRTVSMAILTTKKCLNSFHALC